LLIAVYLFSPDFGGSEGVAPLPTRESLGENFTEKEYAAALVHGRAIHKPYYHPKQHHVPVANIQFVSHSPYSLSLFTHFATHAASALGIPISNVVALPRRRRLWTVIKGPFAHKKSQENFERITHKRAIKVWDADSGVVDLLIGYLRKHVMGGIGMRVVRWDRKEVGFGSKLLAEANRAAKRSHGDKVREMGAKIVEAEKSGVTEIHQ
jgi:small subunit ribosomal protein S10